APVIACAIANDGQEPPRQPRRVDLVEVAKERQKRLRGQIFGQILPAHAPQREAIDRLDMLTVEALECLWEGYVRPGRSGRLFLVGKSHRCSPPTVNVRLLAFYTLVPGRLGMPSSVSSAGAYSNGRSTGRSPSFRCQSGL